MSTAEVTAAVLAMPRSARLRLASVVIAKEGDAERAADLEALARSAEMDEDPARFVAKGSHAAFIAKLKADIRRKSARSVRPNPKARVAA
ncbi:MAG: hypothetical protein WC661_13470 [Opitutaceae bacterium]